jgi:hypothetical protein
MIPQTGGGPNIPGNLMLCCHECNTIKDTTDAVTYIQLLELLNKDKNLKERYFNQHWRGITARRIERKK